METYGIEKYGITGTTEIVHNPSYELPTMKRPSPAWKATRSVRRPSWIPLTS